MMSGTLFLCSCLILLAATHSTNLLAAGDPNISTDYLDMSLEELMSVEVISSARRAQPLTRSTAAIYVITAEDIRMAGVTKLADLFRLVPGMQVKQMRDFSFDVGIRGFAAHNASRIQILLDGVSLYDAYKGGCELEFYPIFLDDIDRIEVIRGPAAVAWGVNAMNGVINIITKKAADTQGVRTYAGFASNHVSEGYIGFGGKTDNVAARATVGAFRTHGLGTDRGDNYADHSHNFAVTGRAEVTLREGETLTVSGGDKKTAYGVGRQTRPSLQYMTMVWDKKLSSDSSVKFTWAENYFQNLNNTSYDAETQQDLFEVQLSHDWDNHQVVWGADYTRDSFHTTLVTGGYQSISNPDEFSNDQLSAFVEDEITLTDGLWFTLGGRLQNNELTGQDWAGEAFLTWEAAPKHYLRAGVSRAFGRPIMQNYFYWYRSATTARPYEYPPERYAFDGMDNEHILAYQLGYRGEIAPNLELDVTAYHQKNSDMIGSYFVPASLLTPGEYSYRLADNVIDISSYGLETSLSYRPFAWWLIRASHSYEQQTNKNGMNDPCTPDFSRLKVPTVPKHTVALTNRFNLDEATTLNAQLFFTDTYRLVSTDYHAAGNKIDPHLRLDLHLARKIWADAGEVAIGIKNANDPYHWEGDSNRIPTQYYAQFRYQF